MSRILPTMSVTDMLYEMSEGNPGAITAMVSLLDYDTSAISHIIFLDSMEIYGPKIYMIWNDCCNRNMEKFVETLHYLESGAITKDKIHENLNRCRALPFI